MRCDIFILVVEVRGEEESDYVHSLQVFHLKTKNKERFPPPDASKFESIHFREKSPFSCEIETC